MKIVDIGVRVFRYVSRQVRDSDGHSHPGDPHEARQALLQLASKKLGAPVQASAEATFRRALHSGNTFRKRR